MSNVGNSTTLPAQPASLVAQSFLKALFGSEWKRAHLCVIPGDPRKTNGAGWGGGHAARVLSQVQVGTNNYFSVSLFRGQLRRENEFDRLMCLAIDDVGPKIDPDLVEGILGLPTWKVETSPANFQYGYKLEVPITDAQVGNELIHRVRVMLTGPDAADPGMESVTRYMRLPCGSNLKAPLNHLLPSPVYQPSSVLRPPNVRHLLGQTGTRNSAKAAKPGSPIDPPAVVLNPAIPGNPPSTTRADDDDDVELGAMKKLGLVLGGPRSGGMGQGMYDIRCPWIDEHTDRAETGTGYVPGAGKFKCHHGHCIHRTVEDLRAKLNEMLKDKGGLILEEFDVIDPATVSVVTTSSLKEAFFARFVLLSGRSRFWDLEQDHEVVPKDINAVWTKRLRGVLPVIKGKGKVKDRIIQPSDWLWQEGTHATNLICWPGKPRVFAPDPTRKHIVYVNTWLPLKRPLKDYVAAEVDEKAVAPWLAIFWHVIGRSTKEQIEIGEKILDWLALVLGSPGQKAGWQVILMGQQGIGKDSIIAPVMEALGSKWAQTIQSQDLVSSYNEWAGMRLVQVSETRQNTRGSLTAHDLMNILKAVFDSGRPWLWVNPKCMPKYEVRNVVMAWFTSNETEPLRLETGDRRFLVLDRNDEVKPLSPEEYAKFYAWLHDEVGGATGTMRVAEFLLRRFEDMTADRQKILFGHAPQTSDKLKLILRSMDPVEDWIRRCLVLGDPFAFPDIVTTGLVHSRLITAIRSGNEGLPGGVQAPTLEKIAVYLKRVGAKKLNNNKLVKVGSSAVGLWSVRQHDKYEAMQAFELARQFTRGTSGTSFS